MSAKLIHDNLSYSVIGAFFEVYHTLGFGFLEHVYVASLTRELHDRGHDVGREVSVPVLYKGEEVARQRLDMIVDGSLSSRPNPAVNFTREQCDKWATIFGRRPSS